jgi:hypothetical protein
MCVCVYIERREEGGINKLILVCGCYKTRGGRGGNRKKEEEEMFEEDVEPSLGARLPASLLA